MKILHCCLSNFYIDNYGYQENILPKMHKLQGHDVAILASTEIFIDNAKLGYTKPSSYITNDGIPISRIPYVKWLPHTIVRKLRIYKGLKNNLDTFNPDVIFIHGSQFVGILEIIDYLKKRPDVRVYIDNHADYINSASNWVSKNILHKIIYKFVTQKIEPYTRKFYGTLPLRVNFLKEVYGTPSHKTELLLLGIDDTKIYFEEKKLIKKQKRKKLNIHENDFVIITGGKIDRRKNIDILMRVVSELEVDNIKLIVFGSPNKEMEDEINILSQNSNIRNIGWILPDQTVDYFFASDLACFPGTHSVLWEQATGLGIPAIFKRWDGIDHIDLNGNCLLLDEINEDILREVVLKVVEDKLLFKNMKKIAEEGKKKFSYYEIAKKGIEM